MSIANLFLTFFIPGHAAQAHSMKDAIAKMECAEPLRIKLLALVDAMLSQYKLCGKTKDTKRTRYSIAMGLTIDDLASWHDVRARLNALGFCRVKKSEIGVLCNDMELSCSADTFDDDQKN